MTIHFNEEVTRKIADISHLVTGQQKVLVEFSADKCKSLHPQSELL